MSERRAVGNEQAEEVQLITLQWQWSSRDVVTLANLAQLGATFAAASQCGNEPGFVTTFAAGVSMRYHLALQLVITLA
jgi:hypothetical protein